MDNLVHIGNADIPIKEYKGERVVTFKDIDMVHERPGGTARKIFSDNRKHFVEGEDYFVLKTSDLENTGLSEKRTLENLVLSNFGTALITERGYLMLVKSFTDDLAWEVQRKLVSSYFNVYFRMRLEHCSRVRYQTLRMKGSDCMNELQIFNNEEFGEIRTITKDNETWFVASDICRSLDLSNPTMAMQRIDDDEKAKFNLGLSGGETNCVNEYGLYSLVLASRKREAKDFKRWITHEVLPSIRKTGSYNKPMSTAEKIQLLAQGNEELNERVDMVDGRVTDLENNMTINYGQQVVIGDEVNKVVIGALGGKDSAAYKEISRKVFSECNRDIKHYFHVNSRNNIPKKRFDEAVQYIKNWHPCTNTQILINSFKI